MTTSPALGAVGLSRILIEVLAMSEAWTYYD
jgi:hypothetical protein